MYSVPHTCTLYTSCTCTYTHTLARGSGCTSHACRASISRPKTLVELLWGSGSSFKVSNYLYVSLDVQNIFFTCTWCSIMILQLISCGRMDANADANANTQAHVFLTPGSSGCCKIDWLKNKIEASWCSQLFHHGLRWLLIFISYCVSVKSVLLWTLPMKREHNFASATERAKIKS